MTNEDGEILSYNGWTMRVRKPQGDGPHPVIWMIHGWTGDEDVMWIFVPRMPKNALILAPRGPFPAAQGGFGWHPHREGTWPEVEDFRAGMVQLLGLMDQVQADESGVFGERADFSQVNMAGFSQGAALVYVTGLLHPHRIVRLAGLAGFLPDGAEELAAGKPLQDKSVFAAHGDKDERVPVERARDAVRILELAGAKVDYCEDNVGHKLSAACFRGLAEFFSQVSNTQRE